MLEKVAARNHSTSGSNREFARSARQNHGTTALGKVNHLPVSHCKKASASAIMAGEKKGLERIWDATLSSALNFWITGHVADETKLWYTVPGHGYRKFSTLSHHSQVTWQLQDDGPILDEDVFRTPEAMTHYSAAVQYHILSADGCAGVNPQAGLRPQARFYGTNIVWDSHRVNKLTAKYLRLVMDPEDLLLPSYCLQHFNITLARCVSPRRQYCHLIAEGSRVTAWRGTCLGSVETRPAICHCS